MTDHLQVLTDAGDAAEDGCPAVRDEVVALRRAEGSDSPEERVEEGLVVAQAVEAGAVDVQHERSVRGRDHLGGRAQQHLVLLTAATERADDDRNEPVGSDGRSLGTRVGNGQVGERLLGDRDAGSGVRTRSDRCVHDRIATLEDPGVHQLPDRLTTCFGLDRVPQVGRLGVAVSVRREVAPDTSAEALAPEVGLEHPQHPGAPFS